MMRKQRGTLMSFGRIPQRWISQLFQSTYGMRTRALECVRVYKNYYAQKIYLLSRHCFSEYLKTYFGMK